MRIRFVFAAAAAIVATLGLAPHAGADPRPLVCQLLDLGLKQGTVVGVLANEDYDPGSMEYPPNTGQYLQVYYTTVAESCPEYCDGIEVACE